jgi:hypothetical protein
MYDVYKLSMQLNFQKNKIYFHLIKFKTFKFRYSPKSHFLYLTPKVL